MISIFPNVSSQISQLSFPLLLYIYTVYNIEQHRIKATSECKSMFLYLLDTNVVLQAIEEVLSSVLTSLFGIFIEVHKSENNPKIVIDMCLFLLSKTIHSYAIVRDLSYNFLEILFLNFIYLSITDSVITTFLDIYELLFDIEIDSLDLNSSAEVKLTHVHNTISLYPLYNNVQLYINQFKVFIKNQFCSFYKLSNSQFLYLVFNYSINVSIFNSDYQDPIGYVLSVSCFVVFSSCLHTS